MLFYSVKKQLLVFYGCILSVIGVRLLLLLWYGIDHFDDGVEDPYIWMLVILYLTEAIPCIGISTLVIWQAHSNKKEAIVKSEQRAQRKEERKSLVGEDPEESLVSDSTVVEVDKDEDGVKLVNNCFLFADTN
jgi:hypothetical protein